MKPQTLRGLIAGGMPGACEDGGMPLDGKRKMIKKIQPQIKRGL